MAPRAAIARNETLRTTPASGPGALEEVGRVSRSKSDRGPHELPQGFQRKHHVARPDRQTAEIRIRTANMNRYNALGAAEIEAVAKAHTGNGQVTLTRIFQQRPVKGTIMPNVPPDCG